MIQHLVLFRLRADSAPARLAHVMEMRDLLEPLRDVVPGVLEIHVGPDIVGGPNHWDVALVGAFEDRAALDRYQAHPAHVAAIATMAAYVTERSVADVAIPGPHDR